MEILILALVTLGLQLFQLYKAHTHTHKKKENVILKGQSFPFVPGAAAAQLRFLAAQTCSPQHKAAISQSTMILHRNLLKKGRTRFASALNSYKLTVERRAWCFLGSTPGFKRSSGCSPFPYALLLHYSPCVFHTLFFPQMTSILSSLYLHSGSCLFFLFLFKAIYLVLWFQPIPSVHFNSFILHHEQLVSPFPGSCFTIPTSSSSTPKS